MSQVFLCDREAIQNIADSVALKGKTVLEIGTGEALLTRELAKRAKKVVSLEVDKELMPKINKNLDGLKNVEVNFIDARQASFDYEIVFGNIPYHLSSELLFKLLDSNFKQAVIMVQKEFADRLIAEPGGDDYGRLSVTTQAKANVKKLFDVPKWSFVPAPRVDSTVVLIEKSDNAVLNEELVRALFSHRNQNVRKALINSHLVSKEKAQELADLVENKRVKELTLEDVEELSLAFH
ncbi:ribosomal RNA small subunit methyltransferase A [Candidatus Micrarchaeota archaeon]|nr:ribosomal RNA small subunit methyltransferase A [Candidatus Micrarchaeota archaeon]